MKMKNYRIYCAWVNMRTRCNNSKSKKYHRYGGRGIAVCEEWSSSKNFIEWALSSGYADGLQIDRIDNDGNYCPENCRWVTPFENSQNKSGAIWIEGKRISEWVKITGLKRSTIEERIRLRPHMDPIAPKRSRR